MSTQKLGFIGLGNMGYPMAKNLEAAGFPLYIYNRFAEKAENFRGTSTVCESVTALVNNADMIFTMLTNDTVVKSVYEEILKQNIQGKLFVDLSTVSQKLSLEVNDAIRDKEGAFIDAPVAGSTKPAAEGTLIW